MLFFQSLYHEIEPGYVSSDNEEEIIAYAESMLDHQICRKMSKNAEKNNVTVPKNYKQQTRWMKREVTKLEGKVHHEKKTYNYLFAEAETDEERDQIIRQFLKQLFDLPL